LVRRRRRDMDGATLAAHRMIAEGIERAKVK
jgi:hypothetical protein